MMPLQNKPAPNLPMPNGDEDVADLQPWLRQVLLEHRKNIEVHLIQLREGQRYIVQLLKAGHEAAWVEAPQASPPVDAAGQMESLPLPAKGREVSFQKDEAEANEEEQEPQDIDTLLSKEEEKVLGPVESTVHHEDTRVEEEDFFRPRSVRGFPKPQPRRSSSALKDTDFALREVWAKHLKFKDRMVSSQPSTTHDTISQGASMKLPMSESTDKLAAMAGARFSIIAYPAQKSRVCWDLFGGLLILYDLFVIPLKVFEYPETVFTDTMDWMTLSFWTLNVPATLTVGFTRQGETVMKPKDIFINYCKTWMIVDVVTLAPDWAFTLVRMMNPNLADVSAQSSGGFEEEGVRLLRILRLARTARLLRLLKLQKVMEKLSDYLDSEIASIMANIFKMILLLLALNHLIACVWYAISIGMYHGGAAAWVEVSGMLSAEWDNRYVTSFHWSITQFTPASKPQVDPANMVERAFAIFVVVFALVGFSYVVGSILGSLAQLRSMTEQSAKDFWMMRRFLRRNHVPMELSSRIQRFVEHAHSQKQKQMAITEVKVLELLSAGLMEELQCAMNMPHMMVHPLFAFLSTFSVITVQRLAKEAVHRAQLARGDTQFLPNQEASYLYFLAAGKMKYIRGADGPDPRIEVVDKGEDWIAEPVMWTPFWVHVGQLTAVSECDLCAVEPQSFGQIVALIRPVAALVARYSSNFMLWVKDLESRDELTDVIQGDQVGDQIRCFLD